MAGVSESATVFPRTADSLHYVRRMRILLRVLALGLFLPGGVDLFAQGSLTPPGPPGPTMKSLDEIDAHIGAIAEKRIPIDAAHTPGDASNAFIITQPGSYYFTGNIAVSTAVTGILVQASNVTIDLNGFSLTSTNASSVYGITKTSDNTHLTLRNGTINGWGQSGVGVFGSSATTGDVVERLHVSGNTGSGMIVGAGCVVRDCVVDSNASAGVISFWDNVQVIDCVATSNGGEGIRVGSYSQVSRCLVTHNDSNGITVVGDGSAVLECTCDANGSTGISTVSGTVRGCTVNDNKGTGISLGSHCQVIGNTCDRNNGGKAAGNAGIYCFGNGSTIAFNHVSGTLSGDGVLTSGASDTIDSNVCASNQGVGIVAAGSGSVNNFIVRNSCTGNTGGNYNIPGPTNKNSYGPVVNMSAGGQIADGANPWTNWIH